MLQEKKRLMSDIKMTPRVIADSSTTIASCGNEKKIFRINEEKPPPK